MIIYNDIEHFEKKNKKLLPDIFKEFLLKHNGISFDGGVKLYGLNEIIEMNNLLQISSYCPDYIAVGDDGGDLVFLMRQSRTANLIYFVDVADYDISSAYGKEDFLTWFVAGCNIPDKTGPIYENQIGSLFLVKIPSGGKKDLIKIKNCLKLDISIVALTNCLDNLPYKLISNIKYVKAAKLVERTGMSELFEFHPNNDNL